MDQWLAKYLADRTPDPIPVKMNRSKPNDLVDACFTNKGTVKIAELQVYQFDTTCNQLYPAFSTPRMVAGEPLANDVLKCQLRPVDPNSSLYKVRFTPAEAAQLKTLFPLGVCDYSKPGVGQQPPDGTWQIYSDQAM
jgi:hypothetical protein